MLSSFCKIIFHGIFKQLSEKVEQIENCKSNIDESDIEKVASDMRKINDLSFHYNNIVISHPFLAKLWNFKIQTYYNHWRQGENVEPPHIKFD